MGAELGQQRPASVRAPGGTAPQVKAPRGTAPQASHRTCRPEKDGLRGLSGQSAVIRGLSSVSRRRSQLFPPRPSPRHAGEALPGVCGGESCSVGFHLPAKGLCLLRGIGTQGVKQKNALP